MVDADTIFIYKTVKTANPGIRIITELASFSTINFLIKNRSHSIQTYGLRASEPFASGEIYILSMLDTLVCQAFYNPFINSLLNQFIVGDANLTSADRKILRAHKINQSNQFLIGVPPLYQDKTFGDLYANFCLQSKMIPLGIYRAEKTYLNSRPYVYQKPPPNTRLNPKDKIYVQCFRQPKEIDIIDSDDEDRDKMKGNNVLNKYNLRTKLTGEDGKIDLEIAKQLLNMSRDIDSLSSTTESLNSDFFAKGLTNHEFQNNVRDVIVDQLHK